MFGRNSSLEDVIELLSSFDYVVEIWVFLFVEVFRFFLVYVSCFGFGIESVN